MKIRTISASDLAKVVRESPKERLEEVAYSGVPQLAYDGGARQVPGSFTLPGGTKVPIFETIYNTISSVTGEVNSLDEVEHGIELMLHGSDQLFHLPGGDYRLSKDDEVTLWSRDLYTPKKIFSVVGMLLEAKLYVANKSNITVQ